MKTITECLTCGGGRGQASPCICATSAGSDAALDRLRQYVAARTEKPITQLDDMIHGVHAGTKWEGELRLSDLRVLLMRLAGPSGGNKLTNREEGYLGRMRDRCNILKARIGNGYSDANFIGEWKRELHAMEWAISRLGATGGGT